MQSFLSSLTPELQITTFWNVCHVFLGTSTTKCGHESNNAPQSFFFHLITFLLEKSSMRNNSPIRSLFHRHSKVNLICGGYKEKRIYFCISCRLLSLSIPRLDFYFFSGGRYNIQYFSLVHSRL